MDPPPEMLEYMAECAKEFGLPEDLIKNPESIPSDKKCWHKCVAEKSGLMSSDGQVQAEAFKEKLKKNNAPAEFMAIVDKCVGIKKDNPCDTAEEICKCMHKQA